MRRLFIPTLGASDWRRLLADPNKHWVPKRSAYELAVSWESVRDTKRGLPQEVQTVLDTNPDTRSCTLLLAIPEHQVTIEGGGHASQSDLWALMCNDSGLISMTVEAKAGEPFDKRVNEWLADAKPNSGKPKRLSALKEALGLGLEDIGAIRYQLLHRSVSAILEAKRFGASRAILLVQSFGGAMDDGSFTDFSSFATLMGASVTKNSIVSVKRVTEVPLLIGWITSQTADCSKLAIVV